MFNFAQTYATASQFALGSQKKGFEALNTLLDVQLKLAQAATDSLATLYAKTPEPFTPDVKVVAKLKDEVELHLSTLESYARDALKAGQASTEKLLAKTVQTGANIVSQVEKMSKSK